MNMPIDLMKSRVESKIREFALGLISELGIEEDDLNIILDDPEIYEALQKKAQVAIEEEDSRRKQEILAAAKEKLGIVIQKPKKVLTPVALPVSQQPVESAWQKYLSEENQSLPVSLAQLETREEVSAARGSLIRILSGHRQNPDWINGELQEAVGVWDGRAQKILSIINDFFGGRENIPVASSEVYFRVSSSLESDQELRWYINGPAGIQAELDAKRKEQEIAQQKASERQQRKEAFEAKKRETIEILVSKCISKEDAEKLAGATLKKFPELEIGEALLKMAVNRQVSAIQQNRGFLEEVAPEARMYLLGSGVSENTFFLEIRQHSEVISLLNRDAADSKICRR